MTRAVMVGAEIPKIENIHQTVYAAAQIDGAFNMRSWHSACNTTHCRAGTVVNLAGAAGRELERQVGTATAATAIYLRSDPGMTKVPNYYAENTEAMEDMKRLADAEAAR